MMTALAKLVAMCFKHARTRADLIEVLGRWMDVVRQVAGAAHGLEALARVMRYILEVNEHVEPEALQAPPGTRDRSRSEGRHHDRGTATHRAGPPAGPSARPSRRGSSRGSVRCCCVSCSNASAARWTPRSSAGSRRRPSSSSMPGRAACSRLPRSPSCWPTEPRQQQHGRPIQLAARDSPRYWLPPPSARGSP